MTTCLSSDQSHYKRWVECADFRHAVELPRGHRPPPGAVVETLCGEAATVISPVPGQPARECPRCDHRWRAIDGIPQRDTLLPGQRTGRIAKE